MTTRTRHRRAVASPNLAMLGLLMAFVIGACMPGGSTPAPTPEPTSAAVPTPALGALSEKASAAPDRATFPAIGAPRAATPAPTPASSPLVTAPPAIAAADPRPEPFDMNLYRKGDFVAQYTFEWCVGASLQMALNMSTDASYTSRTHQQEMWEMAQARSDSPFGGANPRGWTGALNDLGIGPYTLVSLPTFEEAVRVAARAIRDTDRPVGLVMWRGRHAWVMSGFEATVDPARFDDFVVTGVRVNDPLYPHGSSVWGASPRPNSLITLKQLARQYVMRDSRRVNLGVPPGWLLILPTTPEA